MQIISSRQPVDSAVGVTRVLLVFSMFMITVAMYPIPSVLNGVLVTAATGALVAAALMSSSPGPSRAAGLVWPLAGVFAIGLLFWGTSGQVPSDQANAIIVCALAATALWWMRIIYPLEKAHLWIVAILGLALLAMIAVRSFIVIDPPMIDVILVNEAGAAAVADAENPYVSVEIPNTSPWADGATLDGYPYPPLALITYSASQWLLGDTRWVNMIALAVFVLLLVRPWAGQSPRAATYAAAAAIVAVILPSLTYLVRHGWTEPIAFPFLIGAALNWRKRPVLAAILLGLAIATKQYFVLLAPLVIFWNDEWRWRRTAIVGSVVFLTVLPFLVLDARAFWAAAIESGLGYAMRPDSLNVIALGIEPARWVAPALAFGVAMMLGRRGGDASSFVLSSAAVLGVGFLFGSQAFPNYWWLVLTLQLMAFEKVGGDTTRPPAEVTDRKQLIH